MTHLTINWLMISSCRAARHGLSNRSSLREFILMALGRQSFFNVFFYPDAGGLPGALVASQTKRDLYERAAGTFTITLPSSVVLTAGITGFLSRLGWISPLRRVGLDGPDSYI